MNSIKNKLYTALLCLASAMAFSSCNDFVDVVPKGNTIPSTVEDLARMMNNGSMATGADETELYSINTGIMFGSVFSDDVSCTDDPSNPLFATVQSMQMLLSPLKFEPFAYGVAESDVNWDNIYHSNYIANYVLENVDKVEESASISRDEVKGRALVFRAMNYFLLVNIYGKQYVKGEANDAPGVPLVLEPTVTKSFPRATVAEVYAQIMKDLDEAVNCLKTDVSAYNHLPSKAAALALRARVNLWMKNYDAAYADAAAALQLKSTLLNYNTLSLIYPTMPMVGLNGYDTNIETNPEILWSRRVSEQFMVTYSPKMAAIVDTQNDLRHTLFVSNYAMAGMKEPMCWTKHRHSGIDVSEVWLIKAESALRKSSPDLASALDALNTVRKNRYAAASYADFTTTDAKAALEEVFKERRREECWTELSFFDKKRKTADPTTAEGMERTWNGQTYTLPVGDPRWQKAIPLNVMAVNPLLEQNKY